MVRSVEREQISAPDQVRPGASMNHAALLSAFEASNSPLWCRRPDFFGRFVPESTSVLDVLSHRSVSISN